MLQDDQYSESKMFLTGTSLLVVVTVLLLLISLIIQHFLPMWQWDQILLHASLQIVGAFMAISLTLLLWVLKKLKSIDSTQLWIGCALLGMGLLDGLHALVLMGDSLVLLQSITTSIIGIWFGLVWLPSHFRYYFCQNKIAFIIIILLGITLGILSLAFSTQMPWIEETEAQWYIIPLNTMGGIGFFLAAGYFFRTPFSNDFGHLLFSSHCFLLGLATILFQLAHEWNAWDATWVFWHLLRLAAFFLLFYYLFSLLNQAVRQLWVNQEHLRLIMEVAPVGIFYVDMQGYDSSINKKGVEITGLAAEEAVGKGWIKAVHPDDRKQVLSQWQEAINHNQIFKSQHRFKHPNGTVIWVTAQAVAERTADDEIMGYVGTLTDISETKQTEAQLTRYRNHLEEMVVQRANQLTQANQQLQQKIEERQQIEIALRESEARFASILNIAPEAIITVDQLQQIILFNQGAERLFGYTSKQIMGMPLDTLVPSRLQAKHHQYFTEFTHEPVTVRHLDESLGIFGNRQDGSEFPIEGSVSKLDQQKGTLFIVILRDAAKRWQSEQVLRENEEFYLLMMGGGKVGIWDWHINHDRLYISPHFKTLLGLNEPTADLQMADWFKHVYPEDLERLKTEIEQYLQGIIPRYEIEYRVQDPMGHIHWILMRGHSLRDQNDKPYRFTGTITDITELKQIATTLQETEQKYHLLLNSAKEAILILDNQGNVLEANTIAEMLFGYPREELLQSNIFLLYATNQNACLQDSFTTGTCNLYEAPILTKSGQTILVDIYGSVIECGEQKRLLTIIRDIRSRQQAQMALEEERTLLTHQLEQQTIPLKTVNQELVKVNRLKDELLTTISHELSPPLEVIRK